MKSLKDQRITDL